MVKTKEPELTAKDRERIYKEDLSEESQKLVKEIIRLDAVSDASTLANYYKQAVHLRQLVEEKEKFGVDAFEKAKLVLHRSTRWYEQRIAIARKFDEAAILELAQKRDKEGNAFSWTHLEYLALIDAKGQRKSLVSLWEKDSIPSTAFGELVRVRVAQLNAPDAKPAEVDEDGEESAELPANTPPKTPLRVIKHTVSAIGKVVESLEDMKKWNYKKLPARDRKELIKLNLEIDTLNETVKTIMAKFPPDEIQQSLDDEAASAEAVVGTDNAKPKSSKAAKTVKPPKPPKPAPADDDDDLFGDVGGDAPISTDPADLVPVHPAKKPNRTSAAAKKKPAKKALAATGPSKDKRR